MNLKEKLPINEYKFFINQLADKATNISLKYFRNLQLYDLKDDNSLVTKADQEIEYELRKEIKKKYPEHLIIGEELANKEGNSKFTWYIDPIDGTHSFISGKPLFTNLIALCYNNKPILSIINQPFTKERWFAAEDENTRYNNQIVTTSKKEDISQAIISTTSPYLFAENEKLILDKIKRELKCKDSEAITFGGDAYQYGLLSSGFIDIIIESNLKPYDYVPLINIIKESGGIITDWSGNEIIIGSNKNILATASENLHKKTLEIIKQ
jgi:inositol-phosphate phosphatase/L-galactose 1-phosphate phosphatase/histidinol-phosphatase